MQEELTAIIMNTLREISESSGFIFDEITPDTPLFGKNGILDSIGLVTLIVAVEQAIEDRYQISVALADERAFSQKRSPFRSVAALADYAAQVAGVEAS